MPKVQPLLTIEDWEAMPEDGNRYEIIEGELYVSTSPTLLHQRVLLRILTVLAAYLEKHPVGEIVPGPGVVFSEYSAVIPDAVFLSHERSAEIATGARVMGAPDLAIEILSPGKENARRDRQVKRQLYSQYGVREYWVLHPEVSLIEVYHLRETQLELVATLRETDLLESPLLPGFSVSVRNLLP